MENGHDDLAKWSAYREAARAEYEYAYTNANRLDNKVYILLAVCAFLFPVLYSVRIETAGFMSSWPAPILAVIRFLPLICLSAAIILLLYAVKTVRVARINTLRAIDDMFAKYEVNMSIDYSREISQDEAAKMTADELIDYAVKTGKLLRTPTTRELKKSKYFIFPGVTRKD